MKVLPHIYYCLQGKGAHKAVIQGLKKIHPQWKEKNKVMKVKKVEKSHKSARVCAMF